MNLESKLKERKRREKAESKRQKRRNRKAARKMKGSEYGEVLREPSIPSQNAPQ